MLSWLFFWRRRSLDHLQIQMFTRTGCHLCEKAWKILELARQKYGFILHTVDVDADPELVSKYGDCVPVVLVNGKVRFRGQVNPVLLARLLRAEGGKTPENNKH